MNPQTTVNEDGNLLQSLGGEAGCRRLATAFYSRVAGDEVLRPLFPGKTLRCATDEFGAYLVQFLGGTEEDHQKRWWLSLRESHGRFRISPAQRDAWLGHMRNALDEVFSEADAGKDWKQFFEATSLYIIRQDAPEPRHPELARRWREQIALDELVQAFLDGRDDETIALADRFSDRRTISVGVFARFMRSTRPALVNYVAQRLEADPTLSSAEFFGRGPLHYAAAAGCLRVAKHLLDHGGDPNATDRDSHTALYRLANECDSAEGAEVVRALISAGANVNLSSGAGRSTPLHAAARYGHVIVARALLEAGASVKLRDSKGDTALDRARKCRRSEMVQLFESWSPV